MITLVEVQMGHPIDPPHLAPCKGFYVSMKSNSNVVL